MNVVDINSKVIRTRTDYPEPFRYRLWVALADDMDLLTMGYRAYHTHIFESFHAWQVAGTEFVNAKNIPLNLDNLSKDDLFGFLGKKDQVPSGPKRVIHSAKFAVLDAFFQAKYPRLAASFDSDTPTAELISIFRSFLSKNTAPTGSPQEMYELHRSIDGAYIPVNNISVEGLNRARKSGEPYLRITPVFVVNARPNFCFVHKIEFPFHFNYLRPDTSDRETLEKVSRWMGHHAPKETLIYSGIGVPIATEREFGDPSLACILRDRTFARPCLTTLGIRRFDEGGIDETAWVTDGAIEKSGEDYWRNYFFCKDANHYAKLKNSVSYSADFINDIFEMKMTLGAEV